MSKQTSETLEVVRAVVETNCDGETITAMSREEVIYTLGGSGLTDTAIERALAELVRRGALTETDEGFRPTENGE